MGDTLFALILAFIKFQYKLNQSLQKMVRLILGEYNR